MDKAEAETDGLETLKTGHNPLLRATETCNTQRTCPTWSRGESPWRMFRTPVIHEALSNAYWRRTGLESIEKR